MSACPHKVPHRSQPSEHRRRQPTRGRGLITAFRCGVAHPPGCSRAALTAPVADASEVATALKVLSVLDVSSQALAASPPWPSSEDGQKVLGRDRTCAVRQPSWEGS